MENNTQPQMSGIPETTVITRQSSITTTTIVVFVLSALVFLLAGTGIGYYFGLQTGQQSVFEPPQQTEIAPMTSPITESVAQDSDAPKEAMTEELPGKVCASTQLKLAVTIPEDWKCEVYDEYPYLAGVTATSDIFTLDISVAGRDGFCIPGLNDISDQKCEIIPFMDTYAYGLSMYVVDGVDKELFGGVKDTITDTHPWISVTYKNMETQKLTAEQKQQLTNVLGSLKSIN